MKGFKDERLWAKVDETVRRLARLESLAKETRRKVVAIEERLGIRNTKYELNE